jgi:adenylosuccinate synthase
MPATVIVGGQWGDEGKGKIVDCLMPRHDVVIRYQGGANAGHTVVTSEGSYAFHQMPSGILYPHVTAIIGNGVVIDPFAFLEELRGLISRGVAVEGRLFISSAAQVVMFYHRVLDNLSESALEGKSIGSTGKGIGPAYADKYARRGMRMGDFLLGKEELYALVRGMFEHGNQYIQMFSAPALPAQKNASDFVNIRDLVSPFIVDTQELVFRMKEEGKRILLEGAQGTLLDVDHGTYPYVTSSSCTAGGALTGSGLAPSDIGRVIGVFKAYVTRVGNGPFPTELRKGEGEMLRERGREYGTTTGRPRRCGWFDLVAGRYAAKLNGLSDIALTKLDVLSGIPRVKLCVAYRVDGEEIRSFPQNASILERCEPEYEELPGWGVGDLEVDSYEALPRNARRYLATIEERLGVRISFVSNGPERDKLFVRETGVACAKKD